MKKISGVNLIEIEMKKLGNKKKAEVLSYFFKTGRGEYGEGDLFLGVTVPVSRKVALKYGEISLDEIAILIKNKYHEIRLVAILILVFKYKKSKNRVEQKKIIDFYLKHTRYINNWDLVDLSAPYLLGDYLVQEKNRKILYLLANSKNLWEERIAMISTFAFIKVGEVKNTFKLAKIFLKHKHDLIHKASGWMLREVGKRVSEKELIIFLNIYSKKMPRTMLRYAIEKLPEQKRLFYLNK
jgi:3-methyladenine DNA glycosylase AlkD